MRRRLLLGTCVLTSASVAAAASGRAQSLTLAPGDMLTGRFRQERFLQGFNAPLTSTGSFILVPGRGVLWRAEAPFAMTTAMGPGGIVQRISGGATTQYSASRLPALVRLYEIFGAALSGDWRKLSAVFDARREGTDATWKMTLTPLRAGDGELPLRQVTVQGGRYVDSVEVARANGDSERIVFSQQAPSRQALDAEASELLEMVNR